MANRLTHIYTKTGDKGKTGLGDGSRVDKFNPRIDGLGSIDELNSIIGIMLSEDVGKDNSNILLKIQHDLFDIGGELSIPNHVKVDIGKVDFLEQHILVKTGNGESTLREKKYPKNTLIFDNLFEASNKIIEGL